VIAHSDKEWAAKTWKSDLRVSPTAGLCRSRRSVTERTVETHVEHILHKLNLPSRAAVAGLFGG
jgi:hypothetical protein